MYVGTFLAFLVFRTFEFSLAPFDDPWHNIVVFNTDPTAQQFARDAYLPLVRWVPGLRAYPTGKQLKVLNREPFTGRERDIVLFS